MHYLEQVLPLNGCNIGTMHRSQIRANFSPFVVPSQMSISSIPLVDIAATAERHFPRIYRTVSVGASPLR